MRFVGMKMIVGSVAVASVLGGVAAAHASVSTWTSSWSNPPTEPPTVVSAAFAASGSTQLYVAARARGLYSSPDGGATWHVQESGPPDAVSVTAAPGDPSVAYAYESGAHGGIYRTEDAGATWRPAGLVGGGGPVVVDPTNSSIAYAHVSDGDIERTTNGGASWSSVPLPDVGGVLSLAIDLSGSDVYAGTQGSLYKAPVGGGSWATVSTALGCAVEAVAFDRAHANVIFAAGADCSSPGTPATIWRSTDSGAHFLVVATDSAAPHFSAIAVDATGTHVVAAASHASGVLYSSDSGATFTAVPSPPNAEGEPASVVSVDGSGGTFLMGNDPGVAESDDDGQTWKSADLGLDTQPALSLVTSPLDGNTTYAGSRDRGIARGVLIGGSIGSAWLPSSPPPWDVQSMTIDSNGTTLYAGTGDGLWISGDSGGSWTLSSDIPTGDVTALAADPKTPGVVFAATFGSTLAAGGLWRSVDFGASWQRIDAGLQSHAFTALAVDAPMHQVVVAIEDEGAAMSDEQTISWGLAGPLQHVDALAIDARGAIYAGTCTPSGGGVYLSVDERSFTQRDVGLPTICVTGLAADPTVDVLLYATTFGEGVFAYNGIAQAWSPLSAGLTDGDLYAIALNRDDTIAHVAGVQGVSDYQFSARVWSEVAATPSTPTAGQGITVTATFGNDGPDDATNVTATLTLPEGTTAPSSFDSTDRVFCVGGHVVTCSAPLLPAGSGFTFTAPVTPAGAGAYGASTTIRSTRVSPLQSGLDASTPITVSPAAAPISPAARDTTPPAKLLLGGGPGVANPLARAFQSTRTLHLAWAAEDTGGVATYSVRVRVASANGRLGDYTLWRSATSQRSGTYTGRPGTTACFGLSATDTAGNVSTWTPDNCTTFPLPATTLARHGPWRRITQTHAPFQSALTTSTRGARLSLPGVHAGQIALFVDRCRVCGALAISLGGRQIATINLAAALTTRATLILLAPTRQAGLLTVTVTTSHRRVSIDAFALRAAQPTKG
jgi:uncharacterized repeat protein (TIGR01451 family)